MELDIIEGKFGEFGGYDVEIKDGKLGAKADVSAPEGLVKAGAYVEVPISAVIKKIFKTAKDAIPGEVDNVILGQVEEFLIKALGL